MAKWLGMDTERDADLLWIAQDALLSDPSTLPDGWHQDSTEDGHTYYWCDDGGESTYEHPRDQEFRLLYKQLSEAKVAGEAPGELASCEGSARLADDVGDEDGR